MKDHAHSYIKVYGRPLRRFFRKTIYLQCIYCPKIIKKEDGK